MSPFPQAKATCGRPPPPTPPLPAQAAGRGARRRPEGPSGVEGRCGETPPPRPFDFGLWPGHLDLHLESAWRSSTLNLLRRPLTQGAGRIEGRVESKDAVGG